MLHLETIFRLSLNNQDHLRLKNAVKIKPNAHSSQRFILYYSLYYSEIPLKEGFQLFDDRLFLLGTVGVASEAAHGGKEAVDPDAGGFQLTVAEGVVDKLLRFVRLQIFLSNDDIDLFLLLLLDKCTPIVKDVVHFVRVGDEGFDQLLLTAQLGAGVYRTADIDDDLLILAVAIFILFDEHEDIYNKPKPL